MAMIDDFIACKHGRKQVTYDLPEMKEILEETYGVMVYQEQVMQISNRLAGYSLGEADLLRRAMGKKKPEEMAKQRARFIEGAKAKGHPQKKAEKIFDLMEAVREVRLSRKPIPPLTRIWLHHLRISKPTTPPNSCPRCSPRRPATVPTSSSTPTSVARWASAFSLPT
jgi:hypothetical protein